MGRVRTKTVKRAAKTLIEHYFSKLTNDFHFNKKILSEVAQVPSKRLRNKIAGFATHLMKRIQKGPVRGISLKVQEEERERRLDFVPEKSIIDLEKVTIDNETREMLKKAGLLGQLGVLASAAVAQSKPRRERGERAERGERPERGERAPRAPKEEPTPKPTE